MRVATMSLVVLAISTLTLPAQETRMTKYLAQVVLKAALDGKIKQTTESDCEGLFRNTFDDLNGAIKSASFVRLENLSRTVRRCTRFSDDMPVTIDYLVMVEENSRFANYIARHNGQAESFFSEDGNGLR